MRRKNWDEISKRHVSVWKWRNYIEIVRAFSDINIGLPSFAIRCKVESRKTGLPEDPLYLETSVSKTIVRNNFPCRCHDFQSESRINIFMLFTHLLETITSKVLSGPLSISFPIPVQVQFSLSSNLQSVDWVAAGRQPLGPHMAWPFAPGFKLLL